MNKRRRALIGLLAVAAWVIPAAITAPPASAVTCGAFGNFFKGYMHNPLTRTENFEGASGYITNRTNSVCDTDTTGPNGTNSIGSNFTTAWVMIADNDRTSWSQSGFIRGYNTPTRVWAETVLNEPGRAYVQQDRFLSGGPTLAEGTRAAYYSIYNSPCGCTENKINTTVISRTTVNPFAAWTWGTGDPHGWPRWSNQYSGEKTYQSSNILGTTTRHVVFDGLGAQRYDNDTLMSEPCTLVLAGSVASRASILARSCTAFDIWTSS